MQVLERVAGFAAERGPIDDRHLFELFPDPWDFIDLCEDLEKTFRINLRTFFEEGQPEVGWGPWKRKVARDVTAGELANQVERLVSQTHSRADD
jgi:hypothetical protein